MSKRNERRAAEREARKLAYQQLRQQRTQEVAAPVEGDPSNSELNVGTETQAKTDDLLARAQAFFNAKPEATQPPTVSQAQLAANRANAQLSCGPKSTAGRAKSSMNALKHGLTGQTVVLVGEDAAEYNRKFDAHIERFDPANEEELSLVQSLLDSNWRLSRCVRMESALFLKGRHEFASKFEDNQDPAEREALILAEIYLKYEKSLRNLHIQEARLRRCLAKDQAELARLQTVRKREEQEAAEAGSVGLTAAIQRQNGFEFATEQNPPPAQSVLNPGPPLRVS